MGKQEVIIVGSAGHAKVIIDIFEKEGSTKILGLLDEVKSIGEKTLGYPIIGKEEDLPNLIKRHPKCQLFIAIGDNWVRSSVKDRINALLPNMKFANAVHPSAQLGKNVVLGEGIAIMAGCIVNSDTSISDFVIINTKASVDHDNELSRFSSIAPNATTGGNVSIGEYASISISATIKHGISIGANSLIGAGSVVLNDIKDNTLVYGLPAKEIRTRKPGEKYL